ncbi:MAG: FHA domain-containing protein [Actinomycetes bacterium]
MVIELPDGRRFPVTGRMLLGRDPAELDGWRGAELVRLVDPQRSVSKTHAAIEPDQGALLVHDLASTNGTERATPEGQVLPVSPGHPLRVEVGDALHLGSFRIRLLDGP